MHPIDLLPTTIALARALRDIQEALASGEDRDEILLRIIEIASQPRLNERIEKVLFD